MGSPREGSRSVVDVLYEYCHTLDGGDAAGCTDCFTVEGVWRAQWSDGTAVPGLHFAGRLELRSYFEQVIEEHPPWTQLHLVANPRVTVDGDRAAAVSYFTTVLAGSDGPRLGAMGRYVDRLRRDGGSWRFEERTIVAPGP